MPENLNISKRSRHKFCIEFSLNSISSNCCTLCCTKYVPTYMGWLRNMLVLTNRARRENIELSYMILYTEEWHNKDEKSLAHIRNTLWRDFIQVEYKAYMLMTQYVLRAITLSTCVISIWSWNFVEYIQTGNFPFEKFTQLCYSQRPQRLQWWLYKTRDSLKNALNILLRWSWGL